MPPGPKPTRGSRSFRHYMEVVVILTPSRSFIHLIAVTVGLTALGVLAAGCAENITFAKDAKKKGFQQLNDNDYADAAGSFQNAVRQQPGDYEAHFYLGVC